MIAQTAIDKYVNYQVLGFALGLMLGTITIFGDVAYFQRKKRRFS
jgi:hypothetical protein